MAAAPLLLISSPLPLCPLPHPTTFQPPRRISPAEGFEEYGYKVTGEELRIQKYEYFVLENQEEATALLGLSVGSHGLSFWL